MKHEHQWEQFSATGGNPMSVGQQYLMQVKYYCTVRGCGRVKRATQNASTAEWRESLLDEVVIVDADGKVSEPGTIIGSAYHYFGDEEGN